MILLCYHFGRILRDDFSHGNLAIFCSSTNAFFLEVKRHRKTSFTSFGKKIPRTSPLSESHSGIFGGLGESLEELGHKERIRGVTVGCRGLDDDDDDDDDEEEEAYVTLWPCMLLAGSGRSVFSFLFDESGATLSVES